jgi:hypothetical protein
MILILAAADLAPHLTLYRRPHGDVERSDDGAISNLAQMIQMMNELMDPRTIGFKGSLHNAP